MHVCVCSVKLEEKIIEFDFDPATKRTYSFQFLLSRSKGWYFTQQQFLLSNQQLRHWIIEHSQAWFFKHGVALYWFDELVGVMWVQRFPFPTISNFNVEDIDASNMCDVTCQ